MNIEDQAKKDLFDQDDFQIVEIYDPYRNNNILKDSNRICDDFSKRNYRKSSQQKQKIQKFDIKNSQNHRSSLKKLLHRLQTLPSPEKRSRNTPNIKLKTLCVASSTQPVLFKKNTSIELKANFDEKNYQFLKERLTSKVTTPSSIHSPKVVFTKRDFEQVRVRNLIKKKLAQKQFQKTQFKPKNKTQKLINFLRENNFIRPIRKNNASTLRPNSRKLINFIC